MIKIVILCFFIITNTCLANQKKEVRFMKHDEIVSLMNYQQIPILNPNPEEVRKRKEMLVPLDKFLPISEKIKLDMQYEILSRVYKNYNIEKRNTNRIGVDLRYRDTSIKLQWNGTCTSFAGVALIENLLGNPSIDISERDTWDHYQKYSCFTFVDTFKNGLNKICNEVEWPQENKFPFDSCAGNRFYGIKDIAYVSNDVEAALDALDKGNPIYLGMATPEDMVSCLPVIRPNTSLANGGHALAVVGYRIDTSIEGGGYFILKNSWGDDCGDNGYQYLPLSICSKKDFYCVMWEFANAFDESDENIPPISEPDFQWVKECNSKIWPPKCWSKKWCGCYEWKKVYK